MKYFWGAIEIAAAVGTIAALWWYFMTGGVIGLLQGILVGFIGWMMMEWMGDILFPGLMPRRKQDDRPDNRQ